MCFIHITITNECITIIQNKMVKKKITHEYVFTTVNVFKILFRFIPFLLFFFFKINFKNLNANYYYLLNVLRE